MKNNNKKQNMTISRARNFTVLVLSALLVLTSLPALPALAQESGAGSVFTHNEVTFRAGGNKDKGNTLHVRSFDRREYTGFDIADLKVMHFSPNGNTFFGLANPGSKSFQDVYLQRVAPNLNLKYELSSFTHFMASFNQNLMVDGVRQVITPADSTVFPAYVVGDPTTTPTGAVLNGLDASWAKNFNRYDKNLGYRYFLDRRAHDFSMALGDIRKTRFRTRFFIERESGMIQQWRSAEFASGGWSTYEHPQTSFAWPVNRKTTEWEAGVDAKLGKTPVSVTFFKQNYSDSTPTFPVSTESYEKLAAAADKGKSPATHTFAGKKSKGFRGSFNVPLSDELHLSVNTTQRNRINNYTRAEEDQRQLTLNLAWNPDRLWSVDANYRRLDRDTTRDTTFMPATLIYGDNHSSAAPNDTATHYRNNFFNFDEDQREGALTVRYKGWKNHHLSFGIKSLKVTTDHLDRYNWAVAHSATLNATVKGAGAGAWTFQDLLLTENPQRKVTTSWLKMSGRQGKHKKFGYGLSLKNVASDKPSITRGVADDVREGAIDLSYDLTPTRTVIANYLQRKSKASPGPDKRDGYEDDYTSFTLGTYGMIGRWGVGAYYNAEKTEGLFTVDWQQLRGGGARIVGFPVGKETWETKARTFSLDLTAPKVNKWQFGINLATTKADSVMPMGIYNTYFNTAGAGTGFPLGAGTGVPGDPATTRVLSLGDPNRVSTKVDHVRFRMDYDLKKSGDVLGLDLTYGKWTDNIDKGQNGKFNSTFLTYKHKF